MTDFLLLVLKATVIQLMGLLGIFFALGFILSKLQEWTQKNYARSIGWKGILWTAWIGTPFHELGHAFFAKLFRHRITRVALFQPNQATGELGQVEHSYNPASLYQKIGNFFIGAGPMIFGSTVLWFLVYFILPNGREVVLPLTGWIFKVGVNDLVEFGYLVLGTVWHLFSSENIHLWNFWVFLYLSFCVASHLAPSKIDRQGMWSGLRWIIGILLLINLFAALLQLDITAYLLRTTQYLSSLTAIFLYAIVISAVHWVLSAVLLRPFRR